MYEVKKLKAVADEAVKAYEVVKKQVVKRMLDSMAESGASLTASELAFATGLDTHTITGVFWGLGDSYNIFADGEGGEIVKYSVVRSKEKVKETYVRKLPNGSYDETKAITTNREVYAYRVVDKRKIC